MFPPANRLKDTVGVWKASLDTSSAWQRVQGFPEGIVRRALLCCAENGSKQNQAPEILLHANRLQNGDFRSKSRHAKNFTTGI
jgi:hypothetical protein